MFYNSKWKQGFIAGLVTGIAIYVIARSPRGRGIVKGLRGVSEIVKDQVNAATRQATDLIDSTVQVAENISREESEKATGLAYVPGITYSYSAE